MSYGPCRYGMMRISKPYVLPRKASWTAEIVRLASFATCMAARGAAPQSKVADVTRAD